MHKFIFTQKLLIIALLVAVIRLQIYSYDLPPFTLKKGVLLIKTFSFWNNFEMKNSGLFILGTKEQYGISNNLNFFGNQPWCEIKQIGKKENAGVGDIIQGFLWRLSKKKKNNFLFIFKSKFPTGVYKNFNKLTRIPLGTGSWDFHIALFGNIFFHNFELRIYSSYIKSFFKKSTSQSTKNFVSLCTHIFNKKIVLMSTYLYDYNISAKKVNTTFVNEALIKFSQKYYLKIGYFMPFTDSHQVKSSYQILVEFYYFTKI